MMAKLSEDKRLLVLVLGLILVAAIQGVAFLMGMDGMVIGTTVAAITGLVGYAFGVYRRQNGSGTGT